MRATFRPPHLLTLAKPFADNRVDGISPSPFQPRERAHYLYDMSDFWEHEVRIEKFLDRNPKKTYPVCTGGSGACPPEDCGGSAGHLECRNEATGYDAWSDLDLMPDSAGGADPLSRRDCQSLLRKGRKKPNTLTAGPRRLQARRCPFPQKFPLKFRQRAEDMKDQLATCRRGIHLFLNCNSFMFIVVAA